MNLTSKIEVNADFDCVWPLGRQPRSQMAFANRLDDLNGKTIAEVWSWMWGGDEAFAVIRRELTQRYQDIRFIPYTEFGNIHGPSENEVVAALPAELAKRGVDGVILGIANCGSCTPAVFRAHLACEQAGFPAVSIVGSPFIEQAKAVVSHLGVEDAAMVVYPGNIETDSKETFLSKCATALPDAVVQGLMTSKISESAVLREPDSREIVFHGTLDEVLDHFEANEWGDGLPIVPPTIERVDAFLEFTSRAPDEVLGTLPPAQREATIWNVAVNGVMAGCKPEYMPILIAAAEAMSDPLFRIEDQAASPAWETMCIVSGPIAKELNFNHGVGVCSTGRTANTTIGRFLRLYSRNIAGQRIPPGFTDYAAIGNSFIVAISEDEERLAEIGWPTHAEDRGVAAGQNAITLQGIVAASPSFLYTGADDGNVPNYISALKDVFGDAICGYWGFTGATYGQWHPLLLLNPDLATLIAKAGWTKGMLRQYLYENCKTTAAKLEKSGDMMNLNLAEQVRKGILPKLYHESEDPERLVPLFVRPEWIGIVVAGAPTTFYRGYINNHEQGVPITRPVSLPADWAERLQARKRR